MLAPLAYLLVLYVALFWRARDAWNVFQSRPRKETFAFKIGDIWAAGLCVTPVLIFCAREIELELQQGNPSFDGIIGAVLLLLIVIPCQCVGIFARMVTEEIGPTVGRSNSLVSAATVLVGALFGLAMIYLCFWVWIERLLIFFESSRPDRQRSRWRTDRRRVQREKESHKESEES